MSRPVVAIAGNPNSGKTTLFNQLTGANAKVGNYAGVTVEQREGGMTLPDGRDVLLLDIPGTYSLSARSAEEQIAISVMAGLNPYHEPDAVIVVVDSTQLARNLYLVLQILELRLKVVVALNMTDVLAANHVSIDVDAVSAALGVPVVAVSARRGGGVKDLRAAVQKSLEAPETERSRAVTNGWDARLSEDVAAVEPFVPKGWDRDDDGRRRALAGWAIMSIDDDDELWDVPDDLRAAALGRRRAATAAGRDLDLDLARARYEWIDAQLPAFFETPLTPLRKVTDAIDKVLIHPAAGMLLFLVVMALVFESLFTWSAPLIDGVEAGVEAFTTGLTMLLPAGLLSDFITQGLVAGVGAVLVFLPQILMLFLFISILEDSGYMARAAFLMDRVMKAIGLTGRAFVPMLSGYACAIPAIMATRTMERQRDRLLTMMVVPIMTCSARLPVYTLVIAALFPPPSAEGGTLLGFFSLQALIMVAMYLFSTVMALAAAFVLGRTVFKGTTPPLVLELPPYRMPHPASVLRMMWERGRLFVTEAGTVILTCSVVLWVLLTFPQDVELSRDYAAEGNAARVAAGVAPILDVDDDGGVGDDDADAETGGVAAGEVIDAAAAEDASLLPVALMAALQDLRAAEAAERLRLSYGGRLGRLIEPTIAPLGFDWKIGVGLIGAFAAREVFVSTMGIVYGIGDEADETSMPLRERLHAETWPDGRPVYTPLVGLSLMVFFALAAQCMSTLAVVRRETRTWRWPIFLFTYMTAMAWASSFVVYQGGRLLGFS